jgi:hypothetical protein
MEKSSFCQKIGLFFLWVKVALSSSGKLRVLPNLAPYQKLAKSPITTKPSPRNTNPTSKKVSNIIIFHQFPNPKLKIHIKKGKVSIQKVNIRNYP